MTLPTHYEGKLIQFPQGSEQAQRLNIRLSGTFIAADLKMYDFGGRNFVAPLPNTINLNGKEVQPYIVVFEETDGTNEGSEVSPVGSTQ